MFNCHNLKVEFAKSVNDTAAHPCNFGCIRFELSTWYCQGRVHTYTGFKGSFLIQILASVNIKNTVPLKTVVRGRCHWQVWHWQAVQYDRWRHLEHTLYTSLLGEHCVLVITTCGWTDRRQTIRQTIWHVILFQNQRNRFIEGRHIFTTCQVF